MKGIFEKGFITMIIYGKYVKYVKQLILINCEIFLGHLLGAMPLVRKVSNGHLSEKYQM
jgi:hypothetical protein